MVLLQLAYICFPAQVLIIDECNSLIILIWWFVFNMSIKSLLCSSWCLKWFVLCLILGQLNIGFLNRLRNDLILGCNDSYFHCIRFGLYRYGFLHIVMGILLTVKADHFMLGHSVFVFWDCWNGLDKAYHSLITLRIEFTIVASLHTLKLIGSVFDWVNWCFWLDGVFEVGQESQAVV